MSKPELSKINPFISESVHGISRLLKYHRNAGIESYPCNEKVDRFLCAVENRIRDGSGYRDYSVGSGKVPDVIFMTASDTELLPENSLCDESLETLFHQIEMCQACSLHRQRIGCMPGSGSFSGIRLMLVGEWLNWPEAVPFQKNIRFGAEEDRMVVRMVEAIRLEMDKVFITNVIKCVIPDGFQPSSEHIGTCKDYLFRQIATMQPEIICGMGPVAARVLLGGAQPVSRLRGSLHPLVTVTGRQIPVVVTYHPAFLIKNPTMKKAAWEDLQRIGKYLKTY